MNMTDYMRRGAAISMAVTMVDYFNGQVEMNTTGVKKMFNDENQVVMVELTDGTVCPVADVDPEIIHTAIKDWKESNPDEFESILFVLPQ